MPRGFDSALPVLGPFVAFVVSWLVVWMLLRRPQKVLDVPDHRKLHTIPTPRGGGLGIALGTLAVAPFLFAATGVARGVLIGLAFAAANGALGLYDDHRPMRSPPKFVIQIALAVGAYWAGVRLGDVELPVLGVVDLGWAAGPATVLWLVWMTNLYNFMDGLDALAGGTTVIWCGALVAAGSGGALPLVPLALGAATMGFLVFNRPPARIFMGDVGSFFVGSLMAVLLVQGNNSRVLALPAGLLLCGTFVWDATYTIIWRAARGEDWLRPHRRHLFQRLVLSGWPVARVRRLYLGIALALALIALGYGGVSHEVRLAMLGGALIGCAAFAGIVGRVERRAVREDRHPDLRPGP